MEILYRGAEAVLFLEDDMLVKHRKKKKYRIEPLDLRLRRQRTRAESKALDLARRAGVLVPRIYSADITNYIIRMEYLNGRLLKDVLADSCLKDVDALSELVGESVSRLHQANIIHNDLTSANMMVLGGKLYFIDFGLSFISGKIEDKAMDLMVFKKSLKAAHSGVYQRIWDVFVESYDAPNRGMVLGRLDSIAKRARYTGA